MVLLAYCAGGGGGGGAVAVVVDVARAVVVVAGVEVPDAAVVSVVSAGLASAPPKANPLLLFLPPS